MELCLVVVVDATDTAAWILNTVQFFGHVEIKAKNASNAKKLHLTRSNSEGNRNSIDERNDVADTALRNC